MRPDELESKLNLFFSCNFSKKKKICLIPIQNLLRHPINVVCVHNMYNFELLLLPPNFPFKAWKLGATASPRSVMWLASLTTFTKTCNGEKRKGKNQMHIQASYIACVCVCQTASTQKIFQIFKVNSHQKYDDVEKSIVSICN